MTMISVRDDASAPLTAAKFKIMVARAGLRWVRGIGSPCDGVVLAIAQRWIQAMKDKRV